MIDKYFMCTENMCHLLSCVLADAIHPAGGSKSQVSCLVEMKMAAEEPPTKEEMRPKMVN